MPLVIQQIPGAISLSRNDIIVEIIAQDASGDPYGPAGAKSVWEMNGGPVTNGETITLSYTNEDSILTEITFTAVASPSTDTEVQQYVSGLITDHYNEVLNKIAAHPSFSPFMTFTGEYGLTFDLVAQADSTNSNIVVSWDVTGVANASGSTDTAATGSTAPSGYEIVVEVFFEDTYESGTYELRATLESSHGEDGKVYFNLMNVLNDELRKSLPELMIPAFSDTDPIIHDTLRRFYIRYRENWDGITAPDNAWIVDTAKLLLCGGVAKNIFADYNFFDSLDENNSLLSWYPSGKTINPDQKEWIAWYNYTGGTANVHLRVTTIDTATGAENTLDFFDLTPLAVDANQVGLFPVGKEQLGIIGDIQIYSVEVYESGVQSPGPRSQQRTFNVDYNYYAQNRYLMYLNGFCCPETLRCIGEHTTNLEITRMQSEHVLAPDYSAAFDEVIQHGQDFTNYFTYRTGYLREVDMHALQELLIYNQFYEIYESGYISLKLKDRKFFISETRDNLRSFALVTSPRIQQGNYSNINIPVDESQDGWATTWSDYWQTIYGQIWEIV